MSRESAALHVDFAIAQNFEQLHHPFWTGLEIVDNVSELDRRPTFGEVKVHPFCVGFALRLFPLR